MSAKFTRSIFVNIGVKDLKKSMEFFSKLGFEYNRQFTDNNAACMVVSENAFFMLLHEPYMKTFTKRELSDPHAKTEALFAINADSKEAVHKLVDTALANGGQIAMDPQDHGFMFVRSFYDLDGHHWEVLWMDPNHVQ